MRSLFRRSGLFAHGFASALALALVAANPASAGDVLTNGNFDALPLGTGWIQDDGGTGYPPIVSSSELPLGVAPHTPSNAVWLGGLYDVTQAIAQDVAVPAATGRLRLEGRLWIATEETFGAFDTMVAKLVTPGGAPLETLHTWSNSDQTSSWWPFTLEATGDYAGQTVRLVFVSTTDGSLNTNFFLDTCTLDASSTVDVASPSAPALRLSAAAPNPTRGITRLRLELPARTAVRASIHDLAGRLVRELLDGEYGPGAHELAWDGTADRGGAVAPGVYVCTVEVDGRKLSRRIGLIR